MTGALSKIASISTESAVTRAADVLRRIAITARDDAFLGSEEALAEKLGVSAPTLRQAGRILEFEELLRIKRGIAGGYYVRRPSIDVAVATAGAYLAAHGVHVRHSFEVTRSLSDLLHRGATLCRDEAMRAELATYLDRSPQSHAEGWEQEQAFGDLLARMSGNEVLRLMLLIFNYSGNAVLDVDMPVKPGRAETFVRLRSDLIRAILAGDYELASSIGQERLAVMRRIIESGTTAAPPA
ncbi:MAG: FCD domain-containing protein [Sphingobium sp.]